MSDEVPEELKEIYAPRPRRPKNWSELFAITQGRKGVPIEDIALGRVDWHYDFDPKDQRQCGRKGCERRHADGYLFALRGGTFVHIGRICAKKYGSQFGIEAKIDAYHARRDDEARSKALARARRVAAEKRSWLVNTEKIWHFLALIESFELELRGTVLSELERRAAKGDGRIQRAVALTEDEREALTMQYIDRSGQTRTVRAEQSPERLQAVIRGLGCLGVSNLKHAVSNLQLRLAALEQEWPQKDDKRALRALMKATDELSPATNAVLSSLADARTFFTQANLQSVVQLPACRALGISEIVMDGGCIRVVRQAQPSSG